MPYTPPNGNAVNVDFAEDGLYTPPAGNAVNVDFAESGAGFVAGNASVTEAANTLSATGTASRIGVLTTTEVADVLSATGEGAPIAVGNASITEGADVLTGIGLAIPIHFGTLSVTEAPNTTTTDGDVSVKGNLTKTEALNTLSATGHIVIAIELVATSATANRTFMRKMHNAGGTVLAAAPYIYVDSNSALGTLTDFPASTSVSVGQKYRLENATNGLIKFAYAEITQAGTTAAGTPNGSYSTAIGTEFTSGGAKWRFRFFHGWTRARMTAEYQTLPYDFNTGTLWTWAIIAASNHSQNGYGGLCDLCLPYTGMNFVNFPGVYAVSVNSAAFPPTTFAAGASMLAAGDAYVQFTAKNANGTVRGFEMGHDNSTSSNYYDEFTRQYPWSVDVRFIDCIFETFRKQGYGTTGSNPATFDGGHTGARHSLRCTYKASHATDPVPALTNKSTVSIFEVPTLTRANVASSPTAIIDLATTGNSTPNYPSPNAMMMLLGADLTGFTSATAHYTQESFVGNVLNGGAALHSFGSLFKSNGIQSPVTFSLDTAWTAYGSTVVTETYPGQRELISQNDYYNDSGISGPSVRRNSTYTRSSGASDALGSFSYECKATNYVQYPYHFEFFNTKTDESFKITIEFEWSSTGTGLTTLKNEDVWLEAAFLNSATSEQAELVFSFDVDDRVGLIYNHATGPAALATSSTTWSGSLSSAVKQKVSVIVTPKKVGPIKVWLGMWLCPWTQNIASSSSFSVYVCPLPVLEAA